MAVNQFYALGTASGANVLTNAGYAALSAIPLGYRSGILPSNQLNSTLRQSTFVAAAISQFMADQTGNAVNDDGIIANYEATLLQAVINACASTYLTIGNASGTYETISSAASQAATTGAYISSALASAEAYALGTYSTHYFKLPSGWIVQSIGSATSAAGTPITVTLPITFPTAISSYAGFINNNGSSGAQLYASSSSNSQIVFASTVAAVGFNGIVIGY